MTRVLKIEWFLITMVYTEYVLSSRTVFIGEEIQVGEHYWPLFDGVGLP